MKERKAPIKQGEIAPGFSLLSHDDFIVSLADYQGRENLVVYFMREFTCPFCQKNVAQLARMYDQLKEKKTSVLVIGGGTTLEAARVANAFNVPFPVLADEDRSVYRRFGLHKAWFVIQRNATFIIDKAGLTRLVTLATRPGGSFNRKDVLNYIDELEREQNEPTRVG